MSVQVGSSASASASSSSAAAAAALDAALEEVGRLRAQLSARDHENERLRTSLTELQAQQDANKSEFDSVCSSVRYLAEERATLVSSLKSQRARGRALKQRLVASEELRAQQRRLQSRRTPAERVMRRAFAAKVDQLALTHARTTARMLNVQKRCFEEELESLEGEAQATVLAFERQFKALRQEAAARDAERDAAVAKTMAAVKARIERADAATRTAEAQRDAAVRAAAERHALLRSAMHERATALADANAARAALGRKNAIIERLSNQVQAATEDATRARAEAESARAALAKQPMAVRYARSRRTQPDAQRLGNIFASVIADFANAQSDVSSGDGDADDEDADSNSLEEARTGVATA